MTDEQRAQLIMLGIDPDTGRKIRSDKGQVRGPNSVERSDKGQPRPNARGEGKKSALATYAQMKGNILSKEEDPDQPDYVLAEDVNHIFSPMVKHNYAVYMNYVVTNRARRIARTVKHIQGHETDLELRRWNALYQLNQENYLHIKAGYPLVKNFAREAAIFGVDNTFDLMCALYHIAPEEQYKWQYDDWRKCYTILNGAKLDKDFVFKWGHIPGEPDYLPEYAENRIAFDEGVMDKLVNSKAYQIEKARVRDLEYGKALMRKKQEIMSRPEAAGYTMTRIEKLARQHLSNENEQKWLDECVDRRMRLWTKERLGSDFTTD